MVVLLWTLVLLWRAQPAACRAAVGPVGYLGTSLVLLILFWPEAVPFGRVVGDHRPAQVASYAAQQDPEAEVITAEDTGQVPETLRSPTLLAPGFRLLLRAITETPLALARTINSQAHRTFASLLPMQWLLGVGPDHGRDQRAWRTGCIIVTCRSRPATMEGQEGRTIEELLPWGTPRCGAGWPRARWCQARRPASVAPGAQPGQHGAL